MFKQLVTDVFFDLDHTLWDFEKNSALTFEKIFKEHDVAVGLTDFLGHYAPINFKYWKLYREEKVTKEVLRFQRLKETFDALSITITAQKIDALSEGYITHLSSFNHIFPGTLEILDYLKGNYRLHIITNGFEEVQEKKMESSHIRHFFDTVVNSEMAGVKKPNARIFEMALEKAGTSANKALMIGDSIEADILGAKRMGFHTLHFNSHNEPDHELCPIIGHLQEIKNFL